MTSPEPIRVGTRGSLLARTQTLWVLEQLRQRHASLRFETVVIQTAGDRRPSRPGAGPEAKGLFTGEIEEALRLGAVDLAVHSLKDLPTSSPPGLALGAVPPREDPRDVLVGRTWESLAAAPETVRLGTSSLRRQAQLRRALPGCRVQDLRGNLDTRLAKVREGVVDAAVLAAAGLHRLGRADVISARLPPELMLPAPGQGALALQVRQGDAPRFALVRSIHCESTWQSVTAERCFMHALGGGCRLPVAALAVVEHGSLRLHGRVLSRDGGQCLEGWREGPAAAAEALGRALAQELIAQGADRIVRAIEQELQMGAWHA